MVYFVAQVAEYQMLYLCCFDFSLFLWFILGHFQFLGFNTSFIGIASAQMIANGPTIVIKFYDFLSCWVLCATWLTWSITACCSTLLKLVIEFSCIRQHHEFWGPIVKFSFSKNMASEIWQNLPVDLKFS